MLGESLLKEFVGKPPYLERDMRALKPEQVLLHAQSLNLALNVKILEKKNIDELKKFDEIVLTNDEIGRELQNKYFGDKKIIFDDTFLRWSSMKAGTKEVPNADLIVSNEELDRIFIRRAEEKGKLSPDWWRQVGSVIVKNGTVVLEGYNKHYPSNQTSYIDGDPRSSLNYGERPDIYLSLHGEASMISEAARRGIPLDGTLIYVTTFPCPNCARMIANAGIKKVYFKDGYSLLDASKILKDAGVQIIKVE